MGYYGPEALYTVQCYLEECLLLQNKPGLNLMKFFFGTMACLDLLVHTAGKKRDVIQGHRDAAKYPI